MAPKFEGGNTTETSKEEVGQEKQEKTSAEKIKDFEQLSPEEKLNEIDGVMLDSDNLLQGVKGVAIEAQGGLEAVADRAGWFNKIKIKYAEHKSDEARFESIAKVAQKEADRDINNIFSKIGQELLAREADLARHKSNSENDLKILAGLGLHSQDQLKDISGKLEAERESNRVTVENLKQELADRTAGYRQSALEKSRELFIFFNEYKDVYDGLKQEKRQLSGKVSKFEQALKSFKVEGDLDYKSEVEEELLRLKENLDYIMQAEVKLKDRLDLVATNKREVDSFLDRIDKIGRNDQEFRQKKLERKREIEGSQKEIEKPREAEEKRMRAAGEQEESKKAVEVKEKGKEGEPVIAGNKQDEQPTIESAQVVKENKLPKTVDEWIILFAQEFGPLYDRPDKKNPKTIKEALLNKFTVNSRRLNGSDEVDEVTVKKSVVNFLKKMTTKYNRKPEEARKKVEEVINKIKDF